MADTIDHLTVENDRLRMACDIFEGNSADAAEIQNTLIREMGVVGGTKQLIRRMLDDNAALRQQVNILRADARGDFDFV